MFPIWAIVQYFFKIHKISSSTTLTFLKFLQPPLMKSSIRPCSVSLVSSNVYRSRKIRDHFLSLYNIHIKGKFRALSKLSLSFVCTLNCAQYSSLPGTEYGACRVNNRLSREAQNILEMWAYSTLILTSWAVHKS